MSYEGMAGMRATMGDVSALIGSLDDSEWTMPSAAAGWTIKDVVTHMGDLLGTLALAIRGELDTELGIERLNDASVAVKSAWSPAEVVADLEHQAPAMFPLLEALQKSPKHPLRRNCSTSAAIRCMPYPTCSRSTSIPICAGTSSPRGGRWPATTCLSPTRCGLSQRWAGCWPGSPGCRQASGTAWPSR